MPAPSLTSGPTSAPAACSSREIAPPPRSTSLLLGPGPYGAEVAAALLGAGALAELVRYHPHFRLERAVYGAAPPALRLALDLRAHGHLVRLAWSAWRRLPLLRHRETPRGPLFALVDALAAAALRPAPLLLGFSQVSLRSLRRARDGGRRTLLEHPTCQIDAWLDIARAECARLRLRGAYSLLPEGLCRRVRAECDAAERISVLSSYARDTLIRAGVPAGRILCTPLGVDAERFRPAPRPPGRLRILYAGRLEVLKGVHHLLDAFCALSADLPGAELWLAGRVLPEIGPFLDRARRRLPPGRLRVLGHVDGAALPAVYQAVDLFAFPTLCDSFGLVLLEAMSSGLPIITTPRSAGPDLLAAAPAPGLLVPPGDAEALRLALLGLGRDPELRATLGAAARARVLSTYTRAHYRSRLLRSCAQALA